MTRWMETCEGPKINPAMSFFAAKFDGLVKQPAPNAMALVLDRCDEPSQMGALATVMDPIDRNGAYYFFLGPCYPEPIPCFIKTPQKL
jgi:hypothetical protein